MKRLLFLFLTIIPLLVFSQKAKIEFEKTSHDFGTISETGGPAVYDFVFKNTGDAPLILNSVIFSIEPFIVILHSNALSYAIPATFRQFADICTDLHWYFL